MARSARSISETERYFDDIKGAIGLVEASLERHRDRLGEAYAFLKREWDGVKASIQTEPLMPKATAAKHGSVHDLYPLQADNDDDFSPFRVGQASPKAQLSRSLKDFRTLVNSVNDPIAGYGSPAALDALADDVSAVVRRLMGIGRQSPEAVTGVATR